MFLAFQPRTILLLSKIVHFFKERGISDIHKTTGEEILIVPNMHITFGDEDFSDEGNFRYVMGWAVEGIDDDVDLYEDLRSQYNEYHHMSLKDKATITHNELRRMLDASGMRGCDWDYTKTYDIYVKRNNEWERKE